MDITWITLTETGPKKVEKKVLRQTTMALPEIIEEIYQALKNQKYEFFQGHLLQFFVCLRTYS